MERKAFLDQEPPPGYVAGIGRGATGFVTSADSGGIRGRLFDASDSENEVEDGNDVALLGKVNKDDEEADRVYEQIENRLQRRNKKPQEIQVIEDNSLKDEFSDLKRDLASISRDSWSNLPEAADFTKRNKRMRLLEQLRQRFYATPDNIIASQIESSKYKDLEVEDDNNVDADREIADIQKNRSILNSLRKSEPLRPSSWIASARLEVQAKRFNAARKLISEGCRRIPHSEEVWLESIKIHQNSVDGSKLAKVVVAEALKYNSKSETLWLRACDCENPTDKVSQRRVLMKGIEFIPNSVKLWERMIELQEDADDVKKMLSKVVEICPLEWKFWLALINLSEYKEAKLIINNARKAMKDNHHVWITAIKLEEREHRDLNETKLIKMLEKGIKQLDDNSLEENRLSREEWFQEASQAESEGFLLTCKAIVFNTIDLGVDGEKLTNYLNLASELSSNGFKETANFVYEYATNVFPVDVSAWMRLFSAYKSLKNFNLSKIYQFYEKAISLNAQEPVFRLMYAKDKWKIENDIDGARHILDSALESLNDVEDVWHAKIKFEIKTNYVDDASKVSLEMIQKIPDSSPRVWYKHIHLQRYTQKIRPNENYSTEIIKLSEEAIERFPDCWKLHLQKSQILLDDLNKVDDAREYLTISTNQLPNAVELWIQLSRLYLDRLKIAIRARSILDSALIKNPNSDLLWVEKISFERKNNDLVASRQLCNKALRNLKSSSNLWVEYLRLIPKMSQRKNAFLDALKATDNSSTILLNIGIFFWIDGKIPKAKSWFERSLNNNDQNGDVWGWLYNFYSQNGSDEEMQSFKQKFISREEAINRGESWNSVAKAVENLTKEPLQLLEIVAQRVKLDAKI